MTMATPMATRTVPIQDNLLKIISPDRLISAEKAAAEKRKAEIDQQTEPIQGLANHVRLRWNAAYQARDQAGTEKGSINTRLLKCLRQRQGQYEPDDLAEIEKFGGSKIFMMLTNIKCRAAESWLKDIELPPGEEPFSIEPTPIPELPQKQEDAIAEIVTTEAVVQAEGLVANLPSEEQISDRIIELREAAQKDNFERARKAVRYQERKIKDEMQEGGFYDELGKIINDLVTFPACFLKGPIIRKEKVLSWVEDAKGRPMAKITPKFIRKYERVSPLNAYPDPGAKNIQDGYFCELHHLRKDDLMAMIGVPGFSESAIRAVLDEFGTVGLQEWTTTAKDEADAYNRPAETFNDPDPTIDAVEYWGSVQGSLLREWGMKPKQVPDPVAPYQVVVWLVGRWVICCRINPHPLGKRPYFSASYEGVNDSIWGESPPELMADIQSICNAVARHLINNLAIASGPQVELNIDRVEPGTDIEELYPWKIWPTKSDPMGGSGPAMQFYQPNALTEKLKGVYEYFFRQAGEQTGIPDYIQGEGGQMSGAGSTASGLSMLMNAAGKVLKGVVKRFDDGIIKLATREHWMHIMLYDKDEFKCGDIKIVARASEHLIVQEALQVRTNEFVNEVAGNPLLANIVREKGLATLLREQARHLKLPINEIVPSKEDMEAREQALLNAPVLPVEVPPQGGGAPPPAEPGKQPPPGPGPNAPPANLTPAGGKHGEALRPAAEQRAEGGPVGDKKPYLVGEEGPELMIPKTDGEIISHDDLLNAIEDLVKRARGGPVEAGGEDLRGKIQQEENEDVAEEVRRRNWRTAQKINLERTPEERAYMEREGIPEHGIGPEGEPEDHEHPAWMESANKAAMEKLEKIAGPRGPFKPAEPRADGGSVEEGGEPVESDTMKEAKKENPEAFAERPVTEPTLREIVAKAVKKAVNYGKGIANTIHEAAKIEPKHSAIASDLGSQMAYYRDVNKAKTEDELAAAHGRRWKGEVNEETQAAQRQKDIDEAAERAKRPRTS